MILAIMVIVIMIILLVISNSNNNYDIYIYSNSNNNNNHESSNHNRNYSMCRLGPTSPQGQRLTTLDFHKVVLFVGGRGTQKALAKGNLPVA